MWERMDERKYYYPEMARYGNIHAPPGSAVFSPGLKLNYDNPVKKQSSTNAVKPSAENCEEKTLSLKRPLADFPEDDVAEKRQKVDGDSDGDESESSGTSSEGDIDVSDFL